MPGEQDRIEDLWRSRNQRDSILPIVRALRDTDSILEYQVQTEYGSQPLQDYVAFQGSWRFTEIDSNMDQLFIPEFLDKFNEVVRDKDKLSVDEALKIRRSWNQYTWLSPLNDSDSGLAEDFYHALTHSHRTFHYPNSFLSLSRKDLKHSGDYYPRLSRSLDKVFDRGEFEPYIPQDLVDLKGKAEDTELSYFGITNLSLIAGTLLRNSEVGRNIRKLRDSYKDAGKKSMDALRSLGNDYRADFVNVSQTIR